MLSFSCDAYLFLQIPQNLRGVYSSLIYRSYAQSCNIEKAIELSCIIAITKIRIYHFVYRTQETRFLNPLCQINTTLIWWLARDELQDHQPELEDDVSAALVSTLCTRRMSGTQDFELCRQLDLAVPSGPREEVGFSAALDRLMSEICSNKWNQWLLLLIWLSFSRAVVYQEGVRS